VAGAVVPRYLQRDFQGAETVSPCAQLVMVSGWQIRESEFSELRDDLAGYRFLSLRVDDLNKSAADGCSSPIDDLAAQ